MKKNKIAAGVLALALGFGAAAPVHAAEFDLEDWMERAKKREEKNYDLVDKFDLEFDLAAKKQMESKKDQDAGKVEDNTTDKPQTKPEEEKPEEEKPQTKPEEEKPSDDKKDEEKPSDDNKEEDKKDDDKKDKDNKEDNKDDDKKDEADDEEIAKGPYDTKEEATEAAKKALKAAPTMNEYVVYKDAADKFFFTLRNNSTDGEGKVEEDGNEVVATGKKDDSKESSSPARQADNNAKTGVTGLVSVASILGAASVAYVASKKRD